MNDGNPNKIAAEARMDLDDYFKLRSDSESHKKAIKQLKKDHEADKANSVQALEKTLKIKEIGLYNFMEWMSEQYSRYEEEEEDSKRINWPSLVEGYNQSATYKVKIENNSLKFYA